MARPIIVTGVTTAGGAAVGPVQEHSAGPYSRMAGDVKAMLKSVVANPTGPTSWTTARTIRSQRCKDRSRHSASQLSITPAVASIKILTFSGFGILLLTRSYGAGLAVAASNELGQLKIPRRCRAGRIHPHARFSR